MLAKNAKEARHMKSYKIQFELCEGDFEQTFGRKPTDKTEFIEFCKYSEKGLRNGHIDGSIVFDCAKESMTKR